MKTREKAWRSRRRSKPENGNIRRRYKNPEIIFRYKCSGPVFLSPCLSVPRANNLSLCLFFLDSGHLMEIKENFFDIFRTKYLLINEKETTVPPKELTQLKKKRTTTTTTSTPTSDEKWKEKHQIRKALASPMKTFYYTTNANTIKHK